jgi:hypothetical protein
MAEARAHTFNPLKRAAQPRRLASFDTEGNGDPGGFICGSVTYEGGRHTFTHAGEMLSYLVSPPLRGCWLFAHNLEYDLSVLTGGDLSVFSCLFAESRLLWAETQDPHGHKWRFCDSGNLFPGCSVKDLGEWVGLPKLELPSFLERYVKTGGAARHLLPDSLELIREYCLRDADIVYLAVSLFQEELLSMGGELRPTLAGCAMDLFRRQYLAESWPTPDPGLNDLARLAYYGARTEPYKLGYVQGVNGYDVSSLYPSIQASIDFPDPAHLVIKTGLEAGRVDFSREGVSLCRVRVPDADPPPLPARHAGRLFFPTGEIKGAWTHNELRYALDQGARILGVEWSLFSTRTFNPFGAFVDALYKRRLLHASSGDLREKIFKLLLNSSYGRYGISPHSSLQALVPITPPVDWAKYVGSEIRMIGGTAYALVELGVGKQPAYANTLIAAYITAGARVQMAREISACLPDLAYTDTDSLWLSGEVAIGEGLGSFRQTHQGVDLWVTAPKEYAVFSAEALIEARVKGIPEFARISYLEMGHTAFDRPLTIREAARRGRSPGSWITTLKKHRYQVPKRMVLGGASEDLWTWQTRPWAQTELLELLETGAPVPLPPSALPAFLTPLLPRRNGNGRAIPAEIGS